MAARDPTRTPHEQSLDYYTATLNEFLNVLEETQLRLLGKLAATTVIGGLGFTGHTDGNVAATTIAAIWVVTIPSIIEAWIIAKNRQQKSVEDYTSED